MQHVINQAPVAGVYPALPLKEIEAGGVYPMEEPTAPPAE